MPGASRSKTTRHRTRSVARNHVGRVVVDESPAGSLDTVHGWFIVDVIDASLEKRMPVEGTYSCQRAFDLLPVVRDDNRPRVLLPEKAAQKFVQTEASLRSLTNQRVYFEKALRIRGHSVAGTRTRIRSEPACYQVSQKNPRLPQGVLICHKVAVAHRQRTEVAVSIHCPCSASTGTRAFSRARTLRNLPTPGTPTIATASAT